MKRITEKRGHLSISVRNRLRLIRNNKMEENDGQVLERQ
ncbi:hypothetical protein Cabys_567 [Caldithrix abyssi DSM 13497]|uniref:Uncharacterized protein n=1 Tax=Caldithrix abyssi DSM 13497 TaxID=880073 RepID=A0A1J1C441_CALAY|nr:hypothetical protein Cabys_567 [Caldithrix abyssi DSM 13497]